MNMPGFAADASLFRASADSRASDATQGAGGSHGSPGAVVSSLNPLCFVWGACCLRTGSAYCCNHYYGLCVSPD
jgi:hypothetical protein